MTTLLRFRQALAKQTAGPSLWGWALLLLAVVVAAALRLWHLDSMPPGLYRDEAFNGLDALRVLSGERPLYFVANNGREPAYIYLTALAVAFAGRTVLAVRLVAALAGTVTTLCTYGLARAWFGHKTGLLAAWLWAITLWPVHLSRLGLRPILLVPLLALTFWWATVAYRRQQPLWWLAAGVAYGAAFYTYLAVRFTPLLLLLLLSYLLLTRPGRRSRLLSGAVWFGTGLVITLLPLALYALDNPGLFLGRTGQVSILNPAINHGDLWGTLWRQTMASLGLFLWRGDTILRHNPAGRPLFDLFMAVPFLIGVVWTAVHWRRPPAAALLLWTIVMLGPTLLAEDAPHFLRATGILPAAVILPAVGLSKVGEWPKLSGALRRGLIIFIVSGTLILTIRDYVAYNRQADTRYLFEAAARDLALQINREPAETALFVDKRFWEGWPSLPFLVKPDRDVSLFSPEEGLSDVESTPLSIYAWPYGPLEFVRQVAGPEAHIAVDLGSLARGDLEEEAYPLYVRYHLEPPARTGAALAHFGDAASLQGAQVRLLAADQLQVELLWTGRGKDLPPLVAFVHVVDENGIVGQSDMPPAHGYWLSGWWQQNIVLQDRHEISLPVNFNSAQHQIFVGLYEATSGSRLPVTTIDGQPLGDSYLLSNEAVQFTEER